MASRCIHVHTPCTDSERLERIVLGYLQTVFQDNISREKKPGRSPLPGPYQGFVVRNWKAADSTSGEYEAFYHKALLSMYRSPRVLLRACIARSTSLPDFIAFGRFSDPTPALRNQYAILV